MEEKKSLKIKFKTAVVLVIIGAIILTIFGANVYASVNGYGNVFFLIKYLVTGEKPEITGKNDLLSDRDITISYEPIILTEDIKLQIRNLQIKDNKAKLFVAVNESKQNETTPLIYKVYNEENILICEQNSSKGNNETEYIEELLLKEFKNDEKTLHLEIFNSKNEKLTRITINLETREIVIEGEKEAIEKISEIELKKFLGHITALEPYKDSDDERILFAGSMFAQKEELNVNKLDDLNKMLDATGYERLSNPLKNAQYFKIVNKGGTNYIEVTVGRGGFEPNTVIEIKEISYCGGLYTAKFNYTFIHEPDAFNSSHLDELEIKEATVYFRKNEDKTYSTFKVVKCVKGFEEFNNNENTQLKIDENKLREIINNAIIDEQKKFQTSDTGYFVKYFEINRIVNDKNIDIYVWSQFGTTDENKEVLSSTSVPAKLTIGLNDYSLINIDVPPDNTDYKRYFSSISDKLNDLEHKNIDILYGETYYFGQSSTEKNLSTSASNIIKSKLLDKNWLKENTLIKSANGNSSSIDEQVYKFAVIKEQDTKNPVVVLVVTAEKILTKNTFVIRYKNNDVSIEKVSEGHYQHIQTFTNEKYYATVSAHMGDWAYELLEVTSDDIGVEDRNHGKVGQDEYEYIEIDEFERNYNLQPVETELNENNLNRFLNS